MRRDQRSTMLRCVWTTRFTGNAARVALARETREELLTLKEMIEAEKIDSIVDTVCPMQEAAEAHRLVETEQRVGAIVIAIADAGEADFEAAGESRAVSARPPSPV